MEYTKEQIQEMAKIEANDKKHEHIKLGYQDGIYYGFQQGFEKALSLFVVSGRSELLFAFRDYWKKSKHQNIEDAIKGFMKTKKGKQ